MLSNKPYLMRAFYDWIVDSECTPILVLDATNQHCQVPDEFVEGGEIVFNISPVAIRDLAISNKVLEFKASFDGIVHEISAPIRAVLAVYAEENGEGLFFDGEDEDELEETVVQLHTIDGDGPARESDNVDPAMPPPDKAEKGKPFLKLLE